MEYLKFSNGEKMPTIGLGLSRAGGPQEFEDMVNTALELGYRHFDTAYHYKNEDLLGEVLKKWIDSGQIKREDLFITTKLPGIGCYPERVEQFIKLSLKALQVDYIDLYLMHSPWGMTYNNETDVLPRTKDGRLDMNKESNLEEVWKVMEKQVDLGRAKSIGISNFNINQIERIMKIARIPPVNNQVEMNAYIQQVDLRAVCQKYNITIVAYGPLGSPGKRNTLKANEGFEFACPYVLEDPVVAKLALKYGKTNGQILIRFLTQLGVALIPKSNNPTRLAQNIQVFDFKIEEADMHLLKSLDKGENGRIFTLEEFIGITDHPEYPWPIPVKKIAPSQSA